MIPFVVTGGLLIALALAVGGQPSEAGMAIPEGSMWNQILNVGVVAFTLMIPILAGYIAYAIADRPALTPGRSVVGLQIMVLSTAQTLVQALSVPSSQVCLWVTS